MCVCVCLLQCIKDDKTTKEVRMCVCVVATEQGTLVVATEQ